MLTTPNLLGCYNMKYMVTLFPAGFHSWPGIFYAYVYFVNLHKIRRTFLYNIPYCNLDTNGYNNKREEEMK